MAALTLYFKNQGTGGVPIYRVDFGDTLVQVSEAGGATVWDVTGLVLVPFWVGVFDGLLEVVTTVIVGAGPMTAYPGLDLRVTPQGLLLYGGYNVQLASVGMYKWKVTRLGHGDLRFRGESLLRDSIPGQW